MMSMIDALEPCPDCGSMKHKACPQRKRRIMTKICEQCNINKLRAKRLWFTYVVPSEFIKNRTHSAYDSGYEAGWRGWEFGNGYSTQRHQAAYRAGYTAANYDIHQEENHER